MLLNFKSMFSDNSLKYGLKSWLDTKYGRPKKLVKCARTNLILYLILVESKEEEFDVKYADFIISQVLPSSHS